MSVTDDDRLGPTPGARAARELTPLSARQRGHLAQLVDDAIARHETALTDAEDRILSVVPRPLRGTVRKLLIG